MNTFFVGRGERGFVVMRAQRLLDWLVYRFDDSRGLVSRELEGLVLLEHDLCKAG